MTMVDWIIKEIFIKFYRILDYAHRNYKTLSVAT